jgi:hypothetical protein
MGAVVPVAKDAVSFAAGQLKRGVRSIVGRDERPTVVATRPCCGMLIQACGQGVKWVDADDIRQGQIIGSRVLALTSTQTLRLPARQCDWPIGVR